MGVLTAGQYGNLVWCQEESQRFEVWEYDHQIEQSQIHRTLTQAPIDTSNAIIERVNNQGGGIKAVHVTCHKK
jgi:hypothetical protein